MPFLAHSTIRLKHLQKKSADSLRSLKVIFEVIVYLIRRMVRGYFHSSPLLAFIVPTMVKTNHAIATTNIRKNPITAKIRIADMIPYMAIDIWKFSDSFPCSSTYGSSSFFISQMISGPRIDPTPVKNAVNANRWHSIPKLRESLLRPEVCEVVLSVGGGVLAAGAGGGAASDCGFSPSVESSGCWSVFI